MGFLMEICEISECFPLDITVHTILTRRPVEATYGILHYYAYQSLVSMSLVLVVVILHDISHYQGVLLCHVI